MKKIKDYDLYVGSAMAFCDNGTKFSMTTIMVSAVSHDEANGKALKNAILHFSKDRGYYGHQINSLSLVDEMINKVLEQK